MSREEVGIQTVEITKHELFKMKKSLELATSMARRLLDDPMSIRSRADALDRLYRHNMYASLGLGRLIIKQTAWAERMEWNYP